MEGDKSNVSTFSVPGTMSDVTLLGTPRPQAASTATKSRSVEVEDDLVRSAIEFNKDVEAMCVRNQQDSLEVQRFDRELSQARFSLLDNSHSAKIRRTPQKDANWASGRSATCDQLNQLMKFQQMRDGLTKNQSGTNKGDIKSNRDSNIDSFNFCVPPVPVKSNSGSNYGKKCIADLNKSKSPISLNCSAVAPAISLTSVPMSSRMSNNYSSRDILDNAPEKLSSSLKFGSSRDVSQEDRTSIVSSANSSLGIISQDVLEEVQRQPLADVNKDLSMRLAQHLNLDSSLLKDGLDISALASERYKERVAAKCEDNKENQRTSSRSSSDYWTIHGYSSDNSDSRNNTAKRLSALSTGSGGQAESFSRLSSPARASRRPSSEMNFPSSQRVSSSKSGRSSVGSNPFGSYSNVSVSSDDFKFGEDAMQRLDRDERQFSFGSTRSLSGIYGENNTSVSVDGEKLSMSSFLRSGSGPLGCLEKGGNEDQRPQFGMPALSPEKTGKPRAILPPPQDKSTFVVEEPVRDTPWAPHSLMEQFSNIHYGDITDSDTSVPSLSYIQQMLENIHQGANPKDVLAQLMSSQNKTKSNPALHNETTPTEPNVPKPDPKPNRISSVVEGATSFCQGIDVERSSTASTRSGVQYPLDDSSTNSICNVTDFEGDEEAYVCVLTPQSMDFDICNELSQPMEYSFTKACYVDGQRNDSAAYVYFPAPKLVVYPGQRRTLTITIAALVGGVIKIKIEVVRKNPLTKARECSYVFGKVVAEIPRVSLMTQHKIEMIPNPDCEFDGKFQHTIVMKNEGRSQVPLKLTVSKVSHEDVIFHFGEREKRTVNIMIEPGQTMRQLVECETPPVFAAHKSPETIIPVEARVDFRLAATELYQVNPVDPVTLVAHLKPYFFGAPSLLVVPSTVTLFNNCDHPVFFKAVPEFGYSIQPSQFTVSPCETFVISVGTADIKNHQRRGQLDLHSLNPPGKFTIKLQEGRQSSLSSNNSLATPQSSRATSPTSPSSSLGFPVEDLKVACSYKQLVWGGCSLHQKVVKTFCLKNAGRRREKLRLTISDSSPCFKIVNEDDILQSEFKLSLQPMENREVKVAVLATATGPLWGHLTISRITCAADKKVVPLCAFGGKAKVNVTKGVVEIDHNKYIFLDEMTLQSLFVISNTGDNTAFFRINEANTKSSVGLSISPQENVLYAGRAATVHIGLTVTSERLQYLLRQCTPSVCVAQLSICFGDESSRQRLLRMKGMEAALAARVAQLSRVPARPIANLDKLDSFMNDAEGLWQEDTDEWTVRVFVNRTALEALRLDTSVDFVDLSTTISKQN